MNVVNVWGVRAVLAHVDWRSRDEPPVFQLEDDPLYLLSHSCHNTATWAGNRTPSLDCTVVHAEDSTHATSRKVSSEFYLIHHPSTEWLGHLFHSRLAVSLHLALWAGLFLITMLQQQRSTFPSTAAAWRVTVWTLSLVTSALSRLSTCLSTLSLQINNKANVVTSPKEPVPTPSLVLCVPALLPACLHDCFCVICLYPYFQWHVSRSHGPVDPHYFLTLLSVVIVFSPHEA